MISNHRAAVIGSGIGGLSAAIRLKLLGFEVDLYEKNPNAGGKASEIVINGYRFDLGPSLLTMPEVFIELFSLAGRDIEDYIKIRELEILSRNFFSDKTFIDIYADAFKTADEIEKKTIDKKESYHSYLEYCKKIYKTTSDVYLYNDIHEIRSLLNLRTLLSLIKFPFLRPFSSLSNSIKNYFKDTKTINIFSRFATYTGSSPYSASSILNIIGEVELNKRGSYVEGGIYSLIKGLFKLANEIGVRFYFNTSVEKIITKGSEVIGIEINGKLHEYNLVISNSDYYSTQKYLLDNDPKIIDKDLSSSVVVMLFGARKEFSKLSTHNVFFSSDYEKEFNSIFINRDLPEDPTVYLNITKRYSQDDAPEGCENWFTLVNVPSGIKFTDKELISLKTKILQKIETYLGEEISNPIDFLKVLTPSDYELRSSSYKGSLYGINYNKMFNIFKRPGVKDSRYKGLYYVGGSVSPGGGMPLSCLSAKLLEEKVINDYAGNN